MYRVFIKEKTVFFTSAKNPQKIGQSSDYVCFQDVENVTEYVDEFYNNLNKRELYFIDEDPQKAWESFSSNFKIIAAAGGLLINDKNELLMIFRKGLWDLPKGKLDRGESIEDAAVREVSEETGVVVLSQEQFLSTSWHMYLVKNKWVLKPTHWFLMRCANNVVPIPQAEEDITEIKWFDRETIMQIFDQTYPLIKGLVQEHYLNSKIGIVSKRQ